MKTMTKKAFEIYFKSVIEKEINQTDRPALRQAWNDLVDNGIKDGTLPARAGNWSHPPRFYSPAERPKRARKPYIRKTEDEYEIHGNYTGRNYEVVTTESTCGDAVRQVITYQENEPGIPFKIVKKRIRIAN